MESTTTVPPNTANEAFQPLPSDRIRIVSTPGTCGGRPRIDGHRITVEDIAIWHERMGISPDEIVSAYPSITLSDVHAALAYYYENRDRIDAEIQAGQAFAAMMRAKAGPSLIEKKRREREFHASDDSLSPLDENCHRAIAGGLRRRGIDVTTTPEVGMMGATDQQQLAYASSTGRVVFTQDSDFLRLHGGGELHAGIAYCDKDARSIGEIIQGLVLIWELLEPAEMQNHLEYL